MPVERSLRTGPSLFPAGWLIFILALYPASLNAQDAGWRISAQLGGVAANGHFSAVRTNGKTVTSDIDHGLYFSAQFERSLSSRWGVLAGYEGSPSREFSIRQDFPDGNQFRSTDEFDYNTIFLGSVWYIRSASPVNLALEGYLGWSWFNDVSLASAGPPFDRSAPLDIDVDSRLGGGLAFRASRLLGNRGWQLTGRAGLTIQRLQGKFPDDPTIPGSGGDIDVPLNPLYLGVGLSRTF